MLAIFKRELRSCFHGMIGAVLTAFMLAATAIYFVALNLGYGLPDFGYYTLYSTIFVLLLYIPVLTMRSFAEERHSRTDQLLLTSPVSVGGIVLGKYFALCVIFALPCLVDAGMILVLKVLGATGTSTLANFSALLCYYLMGCAAIAIGVFLSSLTENQIIAAVSGVAALLLAYMMPSLRTMFTTGSAVALALFTAIAAVLSVVAGLRSKSFTLGCLSFAGCCVALTALFLLKSSWLTEAFSAVLNALCLFTPFEEFVNSSFSIPTLVYYLTVAAVFLFFTAQGLEKRRWNGEEEATTMKWNKNAASQKGRVFRSGLLSTAMLAAVLVLAVLLNLLVRAIPAKYTEFDLSEAKMYTLSDSTKALVEGLEKDVHIYYLCETGSEDTIITKLLDHYAAESGHLSWEQKDPTLYPTFAAKYGAENVSTGSLIVTCGENSTVLDAADLYEYDYTDYYTTGSASVTFGGEKQITSAIYKLTAAGQSHAYYTTNHGEQTLTDSLTDALDAQNIDAQPLDLLTSTIPEDCDLLIINAPTSDFTAGDGLVDEISQLQDYLAAGGKLLLTSSVYAQTPQLDAVLAQFGLARAEGMVVEGDSSKALYNSAWSLLPDYGTPTESTALNGVNTSTHVMLSVAQGITVTETEDVTAEPLLNSSSAAYAKADINDLTTMEREDGDVEGPFALAVWARNEDTGAEVLWIGCPNMDNEQLYQSMPGNLTFLQGCAASLVGQDILVDTKALEAEPITVAGSTAAALGLTFVFVLPAAVLIAGAVVVLLRRRR